MTVNKKIILNCCKAKVYENENCRCEDINIYNVSKVKYIDITYRMNKLNINDNIENNIKNKGTGAGGANTNYYGKKFEDKTNNLYRLLENGYKENFYNKKKGKYDKYYTIDNDEKKIIFVLQSGLKTYIMQNYNIELFRCPDEAYIIEYKNGRKKIKILEKKEQHVEGSVETKLWSGASLKREYELALNNDFEVEYAFCINKFLEMKLKSDNKKYNILNTILAENNIKILYGDNENYYYELDKWINSS